MILTPLVTSFHVKKKQTDFEKSMWILSHNEYVLKWLKSVFIRNTMFSYSLAIFYMSTYLDTRIYIQISISM